MSYLHGCGRSPAPTDEWRKIRSPEEAQAALKRAAEEKNYGTQPIRVRDARMQKAGRVSATRLDSKVIPRTA